MEDSHIGSAVCQDMTSDPLWNRSRWRGSQQSGCTSELQTPRASAPFASGNDLPHFVLGAEAQHQSASEAGTYGSPSFLGGSGDVCADGAWPHGRRSPIVCKNYHQQCSSNETEPTSRQGDHQCNQSARQEYAPCVDSGPLRLHIPQNKGKSNLFSASAPALR